MKTIKDYENQMIAIELPWKIWQQIASTCIFIADCAEADENGIVLVTKHDQNVLRKTYFQIKAETR